MASNWNYGVLENAVSKGSSNISLNKIKDDEGDFPVFGAKGYMKSVSFFQQENDYLAIIKDGAGIGRVSEHPGKSSVLATMQYLIPKDGFELRFIKYCLESIDFSEYKTGSTIPHIYFKDYKSAPIPLPPIQEQKRIVALLDTAFADLEQTCAKTEQNLKNARELFDSYLQQVFSQKGEGWVEKTLKEASIDFGRGKSKHRPRNDPSLYGGNYPFVQTGDVRNCEHLITKYSKTYNEAGLAQSKLWPKGTICITIAANIAETGILNFDSCFPDSVIGVVVNPEFTTIPYVEFLLQSFKAILQAKGKGSAQDNINMGTFEKLTFPFPSINQQNEIVSSLNELMISVQQLEVIYQKKLNSIDELKKSILQKAFSGELTATAK
jgi:type I restriction enzyme S subunit